MPEPDPRLIKALRELDAERTRRIKAERVANSLKAQFAKLQTQRTADAKRQQEQRAAC